MAKATAPKRAADTPRPKPARRGCLDDFLEAVIETKGSDLHLKVGQPPILRVNGSLIPAAFAPVTNEELEKIAVEIVPGRLRPELDVSGGADFALVLGDLGRFRVNVFRQRGLLGMVFRRVLPSSTSLDELGLPPVVAALAMEPRGLVLVCGPTGSGKTTTCAAMIDHINRNRSCNIVSIEDPIEVLHTDRRSLVSQREIGTDAPAYRTALRHLLRMDPDVIFIGEMRDQDTVSAALSAAETGHLVLSTLHTVDCTETVNRIIEFYPAEQQKQVRHTLAGSLRGIVSQRLLARSDGEGRVVAVETLVATGRVFECIVNTDQTANLPKVIAEGDYYGMRTFDQAIIDLFRQGGVDLEEALAAASNPHDLRLALRKAGAV
jgi:twitching motility protein PilT